MIHLTDLRLQYEAHKEELKNAVISVMQRGVYLMGQELVDFENQFSYVVGSRYTLGVGSGTDALTLAVRSLGLRHEDEVLIPANAYPTVFGVAASHVRVRLCDIDPHTLVVTPDTISPFLKKRVKAIVVVHLYGMPAPMKEIVKMAQGLGIRVIEDCAQAVGATIGGQHVGTFGDIGCFSFYPTKNLAAMGDGGAVVTNSLELYEKVKKLRMYGEDERYHSLFQSTHSRLDEIQSAILQVRLHYVQDELKRRKVLAQKYLESLPEDMLIQHPLPHDVEHARHLFVIRSQKRDELRSWLLEQGIETGIHYPQPIHLQPSFRKLDNCSNAFPISERACREVLSLPFHPYLSEEDQEKVVAAIRRYENK